MRNFIKYKTHGISRNVLCLGKYAFKYPKISYGWRFFLYGILCNISEWEIYQQTKSEYLCPVFFSFIGGFFNIMPRCKILSDNEFNKSVYDAWLSRVNDGKWNGKNYNWNGIVECKNDSFGYLNGNIVAVDYGVRY